MGNKCDIVFMINGEVYGVMRINNRWVIFSLGEKNGLFGKSDMWIRIWMMSSFKEVLVWGGGWREGFL